MPALPGPSVRRRQLGNALRQLREDAGVTADEAAHVLDCHASKLSRIENGKCGVRPRDVRDLLQRYGVADQGTQETLATLAGNSYQRGWWHQYGDSLDQGYTDLIALEATASEIRNFQTLLIPGLLQTEPYLRAIIAGHHAGYTGEEADKRLAVRASRQAVLTRARQPLSLWAVIGESALRQAIGGPGVMRQQVDHLRELARYPNITVQILPFASGTHAGLNGPFAVVTFPALTDLDVVYLENLTSSLYVEEPDQVREYATAFDHLRATALSPRATLGCLERCAEDWKAVEANGE